MSRLRQAIEASGKTQREIAEAAGITDAYLSQIVNGKREGTRRVAQRLARALGTTVEALFPVEARRG